MLIRRASGDLTEETNKDNKIIRGPRWYADLTLYRVGRRGNVATQLLAVRCEVAVWQRRRPP